MSVVAHGYRIARRLRQTSLLKKPSLAILDLIEYHVMHINSLYGSTIKALWI